MSKPNITAYHRPASLDEAWGHIANGDPKVRLLSGGADLTIHAPPEVTTLVDVGRILDDSIEAADDGSIVIGPMATLTDVMDHEVLSRHGSGVIPEMMVHVGNPLLRNFSTIGGHIARGKLSDVVPVFLALGCLVHLYEAGEANSLPLADYYDEGHHGRPHIVTGLTLPSLGPETAAAFVRFAKTVFDFPILNVSCRVDLEDGRVGDVRIVCGATPRRSERATGAEEWLKGRGLDTADIDQAARLARAEVPTGGGWVASSEYRSHLVEVLTRRCLHRVAERLESR